MLLERTSSHRPFFGTAVTVARPNTLNGQLGCIDRSDLPYIYHHLRKGCILQVQARQGAGMNHLLFNVSYGGFHLGVLSRPMSDRILALEAEGRGYRLTISGVVREKYLPPTAVHVELEWGEGE